MQPQEATPFATEGGAQADPPARSASADGRGGAAAPRLDKRTHLDEGRFRVNLTDYGNGLAEIGWSFIPAVQPSRVGKGLSTNREKNEIRAVRRARGALRKKIMAARLDHLLTLTYRKNETDYGKACADLSRFVRAVSARLPGWVYIAVAERQERGAWHWHLAVRGRQDVDLLRAVWRRIVGEGNIDVSAPKGGATKRQLALVKYLGKYLAKGFQDGDRCLNARRYRASLGIQVPFEAIALPKEHYIDVTVFALGYLKQVAGEVGFVWQADDCLAGWACSWE